MDVDAPVELRAFAERVLFSEGIEEKLAPPAALIDDRPGAAVRVQEPARPAGMRVLERRRGARMPKSLGEARLRAVAHHVMANHELQALEAMAWILLAYPDAPPAFRLGVGRIMVDEQRHTRMHVARCRAGGLDFGDAPVNGYVWKKAAAGRDLLDYLACLPLTLEGGNLDHTLDFAERFERAGDPRGAHVMRAIHDDEIEHVAFGMGWLRELKPADLSDWEAYIGRLRWPLAPLDAVGRTFRRGPRRAAGLSEEFIDRLEAAHARAAV